jgi:hypothetical protein
MNNNLDLIQTVSEKIKNESNGNNSLPALVVIFDVNYLFNKSIHALSNGIGSTHFDGTDKICKSELDRGVLIRKVVTDMTYALKNINSSNSYNEFPVILARDDRSWRKNESTEYKGNRVKLESSPIDWEGFYQTLNEFGSIADTRGYIHIKAEEAEADDVISVMVKTLNLAGISTVVISADADFNQITFTPEDLDSNVGFNIIFNNNSKSLKITAADGFFELIQKATLQKNNNNLFSETTESMLSLNDFLSEYKNLKDNINNVIHDKEKTQKNLINALITIKNFAKKFSPSLPLIEVDPILEEFNKIITGDSGDNVSALYSWKVKERNYSLTPKMSNSIYNSYKNYLFENNYIDSTISDKLIIENYIKISNPHLKKFHEIIESFTHSNAEKLDFMNFISKFEKSKQLVSLSVESLPERIVSRTLDIFLQYFHIKNTISEPYGQLNKESFLRGTKYYDEKLNKSTARVDTNLTINKKEKFKPAKEIPKYTQTIHGSEFSSDIENLLNNILL